MVQTNAILRTYFETGDVPTQAQFIDLIDTITASNVRTLKYTIGAAGVTNCNHNFTAAANTTEQILQLGGTTIIPALSPITSIVLKCVTGLTSGTGSLDLGTTSSGTEVSSGTATDTTDEVNRIVPTTTISTTAGSLYFSYTPSAFWDLQLTAKWEIYITYLDNTIL